MVGVAVVVVVVVMLHLPPTNKCRQSFVGEIVGIVEGALLGGVIVGVSDGAYEKNPGVKRKRKVEKKEELKTYEQRELELE